MSKMTRIAALLLLPVIVLPAAGCAGNKVEGRHRLCRPRRQHALRLAKQRLDQRRL